MRSKGSRRLPALSKAAKRLEIERLTKKAPVGLFSPISRSEHWNVPKGRFSAEQGKPQASRIVEGRKAAGDRAFTERSPCGAFFGNKPIETLERPKGAFQCGTRGAGWRRAGLRGCPSCLLEFALHPPGAPPRPPERRLCRAARAKGPACGRARGGAPKEHSAAFYAPGGAGGPQAPRIVPEGHKPIGTKGAFQCGAREAAGFPHCRRPQSGWRSSV